MAEQKKLIAGLKKKQKDISNRIAKQQRERNKLNEEIERIIEAEIAAQVSDLPGWYNGMMVKLSFGKEGISPEWVFTKNIRNRELVVDHSDDRVEYFYGLCDILSDDKKYEDVLNEVMERLLYNKYLPAINCLYRIQLRSKRGWIFLLKQIYAAIKHRGNQTEYLKFILRSNTERDLLVESINKFL